MFGATNSRVTVARAGFIRMLIGLCAFAAAAFVLATATAAAATSSVEACAGLDCGGQYVPEAAGTVPAVGGIDELGMQRASGFYDMPALVYTGDVQPQAVAYLAKAGELDRMPASVRNLPAVRDLLRASGAKAGSTSFAVIDSGTLYTFANGPSAAASRHPKAKAAASSDCPQRYFCVWRFINFDSNWERLTLSGVNYAGQGWFNLGTNFGSSQANWRDGDSLLADHGLGEGNRYCAQQQSEDSTFANNTPFGNGIASSFALLGSTPNRC